MKLPGVISLRKLLPICAMPKGIFWRAVSRTFWKLTKMPWAVSGRRNTVLAVSSTGPMKVLNMRLNCRASVTSPPQAGHLPASSRKSSRKRRWHTLHSTSGSEKPATWPDASHTRGCIRIEASRPTVSLRPVTTAFHHASLTLRFNSTPTGP